MPVIRAGVLYYCGRTHSGLIAVGEFPVKYVKDKVDFARPPGRDFDTFPDKKKRFDSSACDLIFKRTSEEAVKWRLLQLTIELRASMQATDKVMAEIAQATELL